MDDTQALAADVAAARQRQEARDVVGLSPGLQVNVPALQIPPEYRAVYAAARARPRVLAALEAARLQDSWEATVEVRRLQDQARDRAWSRCLPKKYADADVTKLKAQQDPDGRVSGWLEAGGRNLLLVGPSRHGKSYSAYALGSQARAAGQWVLAWSAPAFFDAVKPSAPDNGVALHHAKECDLLILDDLGRDRETDWTRERLYLVVDARVVAGLRTIVTTNERYDTHTDPSTGKVTPGLVDRYGDPVMQRLLEDGSVVKVHGKPLSEPAPW